MAVRIACLTLLALGLAGCGPQDPIRHYQVRKPEAANSGARPTTLGYDVPAGWTPGEAVVSRGGIQVRRDAAFEARDGDRRAEITVTSLPAAANPVLSNVNRWRQQIQLEPVTQEQFERDVAKIQIGDTAADYVRLAGPRETILGVVVMRQETAWFVKLQGAADLAARERERFEAFVKSLRFE